MSDVAELIRGRLRAIPDFPQPGVLFQDITPLLADPVAFRTTIDAVVAAHPDIDVVAGVEARGFIVAAAVAYAAGVGLVPIRKAGKLPAATVQETYALEYGEATVELHADAVAPGTRVLLVDDVLATGGTLRASLRLLRRVGAEVAGLAVIVELAALGGRELLAPDTVSALLSL